MDLWRIIMDDSYIYSIDHKTSPTSVCVHHHEKPGHLRIPLELDEEKYSTYGSMGMLTDKKLIITTHKNVYELNCNLESIL